VSKYMGHKNIITTVGNYFKGDIHERLKETVVRSDVENKMFVIDIFGKLIDGARDGLLVSEAVSN